MNNILNKPFIYHAYQVTGGFFGARLKGFRDYIDFSGVKRIFDIGCGPGHIVKFIPDGIDYVGFDNDPRYIEYANAKFGSRARFVERMFDASAADDFGQPDLILMNGVLHHMSDETARLVVVAAAKILPAAGRFFALDGCYAPGQNPISKYLLDHDRGKFIRTAAAYKALVADSFPSVESFVRDDLSWVPYTFAITIAKKVN